MDYEPILYPSWSYIDLVISKEMTIFIVTNNIGRYITIKDNIKTKSNYLPCREDDECVIVNLNIIVKII